MGTIAEKLSYLDTTREKILTETNRLGVGLTEQDKFRDYAKGLHDGYIDVINNGTDTLYDNMEKVTGEGSNITLTGIEEAPMRSEIEGDTSQETTTGKNLYDKTTYPMEQGSFNYNTNANQTSDNRIRSPFFAIQPNTTYTISCNEEIGEFGVVYKQSDSTTVVAGIGVDTTNKYYTFTTPNNAYYMRFRIGSATYVKTYTIDYEIQLEKGNTATTYEPYTGGQPAPNPNYPQEIEVVSGMQNITTCSYNFINVNNITPPQYSKDNSIYLYSGEYYCYVLVSDYTNFNSFLRYSTTKNGTYTTFGTTANEYGKVDQKMQYYVKKCKLTITKPCWVGIDISDNRQQTISAVMTRDSTYYSSVRNDYKAGDSFEGSTYYNVLFKEYDGNTYKINLGENLFPTPYNESSTTKNGITFTILEDGSINVSGTATAKTSFALRNRDIRLDLQIGETYTVAATGLGVIDSTIWLDTYGTSSSFLGKWALTSTINHTTAVAQEKDLQPYIAIAVENGATIDTNVKVWVYKGAYDENITYKTYKTPIELCKIGDYKDRIFRSEGKNLWDEEYVGIQNDLIYKAIYVGDGTFTLSTTMPKTTSNFTNLFFLAGNVSTGASTQNNGVSYGIPRTQQSVDGYITIAYRNSENVSPIDYTTMLNEGSIPLPYEPYNSKGKWLLHKEIGKVVLDGSETYWNDTPSGFNRFGTGINNLKKFSARNINGILSTHFIPNINNDLGIIYSINDSLCLYPTDTTITTPTDFKTWLSTHNTIVYYPLETPTTTEITDTELLTQLNNWYNQKSIEGETNISVTSEDLPAILNVKALKQYA